MKHLKYFEQASAYEAYKTSGDYILPNVSYVVETKGVKYNPFVKPKETRLVCTYDVIDTTYPTVLCFDLSSFASMEIDGVMMDKVIYEYSFNTLGEHIVKFELIDPTIIGDCAFENTECLTGELIIPDSVTTIGRSAFGGCYNLKSVKIGSGVTSIGNTAFNCSGLTEIVVEEGNPVYDSRENCNCIIETNTNTLIRGCSNSFIPDSVTTIGDWAFDNCYDLTGELIIPDSVTTIGRSAFMYCEGLTGELVIPDSVTSIGYGAFWDCKGLTSVVIGSGCTTIDDGAFYNNQNLTEIVCHAVIAPTIHENTFSSIKNDGVLKVPTGSDYNSWMNNLNAYNWNNWTIEYI